MSMPTKCPYCDACFSNAGCIARHVRKWHRDKLHDYIKSLDKGRKK